MAIILIVDHLLQLPNAFSRTRSSISHENESFPQSQPETADIPAEIKWYKVPPSWENDTEWTLEVIGAFFDYRLNVVAILLSSDAERLLKKTPSPPFTFYCIFRYEGMFVSWFIN